MKFVRCLAAWFQIKKTSQLLMKKFTWATVFTTKSSLMQFGNSLQCESWILWDFSVNSCFWSWVCCQIFFCFKRHANKAKGSIQCRIDPFTSFVCQAPDNCNNSYCEDRSMSQLLQVLISFFDHLMDHETLALTFVGKILGKDLWVNFCLLFY